MQYLRDERSAAWIVFRRDKQSNMIRDGCNGRTHCCYRALLHFDEISCVVSDITFPWSIDVDCVCRCTSLVLDVPSPLRELSYAAAVSTLCICVSIPNDELFQLFLTLLDRLCCSGCCCGRGR